MRRLILGTAGHIDHGKTTLVRALTGTDTDRLPEEKRRGITIDIGFASLAIDDRIELGIVDVPGHEAFVRNMLAGATGIDVALLVVAADEGVMPQTREHFAILELLGVTRAVVALTKADLVEDEWLSLVRDDVRELLGGGPVADAPIVAVSGRTGAGIPDLVEAIAGAATGNVTRDPDDLFRLPIDRVFTVRGTGTVITGTVWSGYATRDDTLRLLPADRPVRLRGLQAHGQDRDRVEAGERAALALAAVSREDTTRGDVLVAGEGWKASSMVTVRLHTLADARPVRTRQRVRFHLGTAEVLGRVVTLGEGSIDPGATGWAQLRLETPLVCRAGDRFVVRSYSPVTTIAGGVVIEPQAPKRKRLTAADSEELIALSAADPAIRIAAACRIASWEGVRLDALPVVTGSSPRVVEEALVGAGGAVVMVEDRVFHTSFVHRARTLLLEAVDAFHRRHPLEQGIDREELRRALPAAAAASLAGAALDDLLAEGGLRAEASRVSRATFSPRLTADQTAALSALHSFIREAGLAGPAAHDLPPMLAGRPDLSSLIRLLEHDGSIVRLGGDLLLDSGVVDGAVAAVRDRFAGRSDLAPADFRELLGLTRKYLIPLLEHMDWVGITRRHGDAREVAPT